MRLLGPAGFASSVMRCNARTTEAFVSVIPTASFFLLEAICPKTETQNPNLQVLSVGLCLIRMTKRTTNDLWTLLRRHVRPTSKS